MGSADGFTVEEWRLASLFGVWAEGGKGEWCHLLKGYVSLEAPDSTRHRIKIALRESERDRLTRSSFSITCRVQTRSVCAQ